MGAVSGAFAAAATTPLDVIKTNMMCCAASRPTMVSASRAVWAQVRASCGRCLFCNGCVLKDWAHHSCIPCASAVLQASRRGHHAHVLSGAHSVAIHT